MAKQKSDIILKAPPIDFRQRAKNLKNQAARIWTGSPQQPISRLLIPAKGLFLPLCLMALSILICSHRLSSPTPFQKAKEEVVKNPYNIEARFVLVENFLNNHQTQEAEKELLKIRSLTESRLSNGQVLGQNTNSRLEKLWQEYNRQNDQKIKITIKQWQQFLQNNPSYRDGYLHLALLHYQVNEPQKAHESLQKAIEIDPNHEVSRQVEHLID